MLPCGKTIRKEGVIQVSYKRRSSDSVNNVVGARVRLYWVTSNGDELMREVCLPKKLSGKECPWPASESPRPEVDFSPKNLSENDVETLAKQYFDAWESHDYTAWRDMLAPFHYGDDNLKELAFNRFAVKRGEVLKVDGCNVYVELTYKNGHQQQGWLQFHSSGNLKYTPLLFKHPVTKSLMSFRHLFSKELNNMGTRDLSEAGIPMFGYIGETTEETRRRSIQKIFEWFKQNGASYDVGDYKIKIPEEQFDTLLMSAEKAIADGDFY